MLPAPILRLSLPLALAILLIVPSPARADCTTPAGVAGKIIFNTTYNVMQYCNGINWINMGGVASNSTAAGSSGAIQFNTGNLLDGEAALTWDKTNDRFGIGTATPSTTLDVVGTASVSGAVTLGSTLTGVTGIGIGTSSVNSKAVLDVVSTTKGFLPPRMTTAQRDAISSPATGLTIYNTTSNALNYFNGTGWQDAGGSYVETDPQVGTLTAGNFCLANGGGTAIDCTTAAIAISSISATGTPSSSTFLRGDGSWASPGSGVSGGSAGYAAVFSSATALTTDSALYVDTTNHRLGIGTTSPGDKVHVYTGGNAGLTIQGTSATNGPWLKLDNSGASGRPWYILSAGSGNGGGSGALEIYDGTAAATRLMINTSGNVGIGTASPGTSLQVYGGIRARGGAPGSNGANNNGYAFSGSSGDTDSGMFSDADGVLELYTNSYERLRIDSSGNVGIGTTNPGGKLAVSDGTDAVLLNLESGTPRIQFDDAGQTRWEIDSSGGVLRFFQPGVVKMAINGSGNVGIGTTSPGSKLDVRGGQITVQSEVAFIDENPGNGIQQQLGLYNWDGTFVIANYSSAYGWQSNRMTIDSSGGVTATGGFYVNSTQIQGTSGRNYFRDAEGAGNLRVGAAWGMPGIYAEDGQNAVVGASGGTVYLRNNVLLDSGGLRVGTTSSDGKIHVYSNSGHALYSQTDASGAIGTFGYAPAGYGGYFNGGTTGLFATAGNGYHAYIGHPSGWALHSDNASIYIAGSYQGSDARLKEDVHDIEKEGALETLMKLRPVSFKWKSDAEQARSHKGVQYGLIAQEVLKVLSNLVLETGSIAAPAVALPNTSMASETKTASSPPARRESLNQKLGKTLAMDYTALVPWLLAGVQEVKTLLDANHVEFIKLKAANENLRKELKAANDNQAAALKALEAEFRAYKAAHP